MLSLLLFKNSGDPSVIILCRLVNQNVFHLFLVLLLDKKSSYFSYKAPSYLGIYLGWRWMVVCGGGKHINLSDIIKQIKNINLTMRQQYWCQL